MSLSMLPLFEPKIVSAGPELLYTAAAVTRIERLVGSTSFGVAVTLTLFLVPQGFAPNQGTTMLPPFAISANTAQPLDQVQGLILGIGDQIWAQATPDSQLVLFGAGITQQ